MTWRILPILALAATCLGFPQQGSLDDLITDVVNNNHQGANRQPPMELGNQPQANAEDANLDSLIGTVFQPPNSDGSTTSGTILGTQNNQPSTPNNCECVPYYQCREGKILENGIGLLDFRSGLSYNDDGEVRGSKGPCENYLDVCCQPPNVVHNDTRIVPTPVPRLGCGQRHPEGVGFRITGQRANEAQFGEFPWMVAILREEPIGADGQKLNVYQCGGALIHRRAVLTAAHCVNGKQPSELRVRAGEWDTQTKNEVFPHQDRNVETVVVHEKFHSGALYNDYAILILSQPVDLADNVDTVCLPDENTIFNMSQCFASGWGKDIFGKEGRYQVILKKVVLPIVGHDACQTALRTTRLGHYFSLHNTFICAGGQSGKDTCKGDGGSPLVCPIMNDQNRFVQVGIVAWGIGCGDDIPGVYANIIQARPWIDEQMAYYNLDNTVYQYVQ